jgi:hypothetical protein
VDVGDRVDCLELDDDRVLDEEVETVAAVQMYAAIDKWERLLGFYF